jgi:hypothetical protein
MEIDFRERARSELEIAKGLLADPTRLNIRHAALALRLALEALIYDRATLYESDLSSDDYDTWQPRKLLATLLEIDPGAGSSISIEIAEGNVGEPNGNVFRSMGKEEVLSIQTLKRHYDALGSFLHFPTLKSLKNGGDHRPEKIKDRCEELAAEIDKIVASKLWHWTVNRPSELTCLECCKLIRRRMPLGESRRVVKCTTNGCPAEYEVSTRHDDMSVQWRAQAVPIQCINELCEGKKLLWQSERHGGTEWGCQTCDRTYKLALKVVENK